MCVCAYVRMCVFVIRYEALLAIDWRFSAVLLLYLNSLKRNACKIHIYTGWCRRGHNHCVVTADFAVVAGAGAAATATAHKHLYTHLHIAAAVFLFNATWVSRTLNFNYWTVYTRREWVEIDEERKG